MSGIGEGGIVPRGRLAIGVLVWDFVEQQWWKKVGGVPCDYTPKIDEAGIFAFEEVLPLCYDENAAMPIDKPAVAMVPVPVRQAAEGS